MDTPCTQKPNLYPHSCPCPRAGDLMFILTLFPQAPSLFSSLFFMVLHHITTSPEAPWSLFQCHNYMPRSHNWKSSFCPSGISEGNSTATKFPKATIHTRMSVPSLIPKGPTIDVKVPSSFQSHACTVGLIPYFPKDSVPLPSLFPTPNLHHHPWRPLSWSRTQRPHLHPNPFPKHSIINLNPIPDPILLPRGPISPYHSLCLG